MPDAFATWPRPLARIALAMLLAALALSAFTVPPATPPTGTAITGRAEAGSDTASEQLGDLALYEAIVERMRGGESYHDAASKLHRANGYPLRPGLTVRLPTLALAHSLLGTNGMIALSLLVTGAAVLAVLRRLGGEPGGRLVRIPAALLLVVALAATLNPRYLTMHEAWSARLLVLAFGLHRPEQRRWAGALLATAGAMAIRELAAPFAMLMAAFALWRREWREASAWLALLALSALGLSLHLAAIAARLEPGDAISPSWLALGLWHGFADKIVLSTPLVRLPMAVAAPLVVLGLAGWTGWRSSAAAFAALLVAGYTAAFMVVGRADNFYWGVVIAPFLFMGIGIAPFTLAALARRAFARPADA